MAAEVADHRDDRHDTDDELVSDDATSSSH
jgi:hypothetical protein